tara:strand:+ start:672 stop:785 length:114 start_codon:yes stop_codon:yes gene_type:complete
MSNKKEGVIYIGFSGNFKQRLIQHKKNTAKGLLINIT